MLSCAQVTRCQELAYLRRERLQHEMFSLRLPELCKNNIHSVFPSLLSKLSKEYKLKQFIHLVSDLKDVAIDYTEMVDELDIRETELSFDNFIQNLLNSQIFIKYYLHISRRGLCAAPCVMPPLPIPSKSCTKLCSGAERQMEPCVTNTDGATQYPGTRTVE